MRPAKAIACVLAVAAPAAADPTPVASRESQRPAGEQPPVPTQPTSGAPVPGDESGRIDHVGDGDTVARKLARAALFVPRMMLLAAIAPFRGAVWANDRYLLEERYYETFYNADRTIGLIPKASYQTGFGGSIGARFLDLDLAGEQEHVTLEATYGGNYRSGASTWLGTGNRLGRLELGIGGNFDRRPADPFYGIGNLDLGPRPTDLVDPFTAGTAFETRVRYQEARAAISADLRLRGDFHIGARGEETDLTLGHSTTGPAIEDVYMTDGLVGFVHGVRHVYGELQLRWDTRRQVSRWEPHDLHGAGSLVGIAGGPVHELDGQPDFWHVGVELQHYLRFGAGPRELVLRVHGEAISATREQAPFSELPALGGDSLRGYPFERFRDRVAAFGSAEYVWDLSHYTAAYLFVDAGRVFPSVDELSFQRLRAGYGIGLQLHDNGGHFIVEGSVASSIDGGVIFTAAFTPVLDERPRWR